MTVNIENLKKLYFDESKHSIYQNIPAFVQEALEYTVEIDERWRGDTARWQNLLQQVNFDQLEVIGDIGANTGFFSLSLAHRFPNLKVYAYESNANHHDFMNAIKSQFRMNNMVVENKIVDLDNVENIHRHDCLLNYNVLHHAGVDFDRGRVTIDSFPQYAAAYLKKLSYKTKYMVFQMGFNWGGDKSKPLVPLNEDAEKVRFVGAILRNSGWFIQNVFTVRYPEDFSYYAIDNGIIQILNEESEQQKEMLVKYYSQYQPNWFSEFYRRPLFYAVSKNYL